jgi:hypothetical protein
VKLVAHPPERRRRTTTLLSPACCCCCCCCVHSVGGVAGAVYASLRRGAASEDPDLDKTLRRTVRVYWLLFTLIAFVTVTVSTLSHPHIPLYGAVITGVGLPLCQFGASLATWTWLTFTKQDRLFDSYRLVGRITLLTFLGAAAGLLGTWLSIGMIGPGGVRFSR